LGLVSEKLCASLVSQAGYGPTGNPNSNTEGHKLQNV